MKAQGLADTNEAFLVEGLTQLSIATPRRGPRDSQLESMKGAGYSGQTKDDTHNAFALPPPAN